MYIRAAVVILALMAGFTLYQSLLTFVYPNPTFLSTRELIKEALLTSAAFGMVAAIVVFEQSGRSESYKIELRFMVVKVALSAIVFLSVLFYLRSGFSDFYAELAPRFATLAIPAERIKIYLAPLASALGVIVLCFLRWAVSHRKKAGERYQSQAR